MSYFPAAYTELRDFVESHTHGGDTIEASTLADALLEVVKYHRPNRMQAGHFVCHGCDGGQFSGSVPWPCGTVRALVRSLDLQLSSFSDLVKDGWKQR